MTSIALLALDLREPVGPPTELALVLGTLLLCGDWPSPVKSGGDGAAEVEVSIGGGITEFERVPIDCCGVAEYSSLSIAWICLPKANRLSMTI